MKALQGTERELEQQRKQHHVAMDKLLLQNQSLEQALKTERHVVTEEKWVQHMQWTRTHTCACERVLHTNDVYIYIEFYEL